MEQVAFTWRWLEKWSDGFPGESAFRPGLRDTVRIGSRQEWMCFYSTAMRTMSLFQRDQGGALLLMNHRGLDDPGPHFAQECEALVDAYYKRSLMPLPSGPEFERAMRMIAGILGSKPPHVESAPSPPPKPPPFQVLTATVEWQALESYENVEPIGRPSDLDSVREYIRSRYGTKDSLHAGRDCVPMAWIPVIHQGDPEAFVHVRHGDCVECIVEFSRERQADWEWVAEYTSDYYLERYPKRIKRFLAEEIRLDDGGR